MGAITTPAAVPGLALSILCHALGMPILDLSTVPQNAINAAAHHVSTKQRADIVLASLPTAPHAVVRDFAQYTSRQPVLPQAPAYKPAAAEPVYVVPDVVEEDPSFYAPLRPLKAAVVPPVTQPVPVPDNSYGSKVDASLLLEPSSESSQSATRSDEWHNSSAELEQQELALFVMVNRERQSRGMKPLTLSPLLCQVARAHSEDMCRRNYFDHLAPAPGPSSPLDRYLAAVGQRPDRAMLGENIYYRSATDSIGSYAAQSHDAFMHSPGHRANILTPQYDQGGIGIYRNPATGEFWVTEEFLTQSP